MEYRLVVQNGRASEAIASQDCESDVTATSWALDWARHHADHDDYILEKADGTKSYRLIHTIGGQWYAMQGGGAQSVTV